MVKKIDILIVGGGPAAIVCAILQENITLIKVYWCWEIKQKNQNWKRWFLHEYEKLVLATGSKAVSLPISGIDKKNVYFMHKDMNYQKKLVNEIKEC